jgi:hypothetical protein
VICAMLTEFSHHAAGCVCEHSEGQSCISGALD